MKSNNRYLGALILLPLIVFLFLGGVWLKYANLVLGGLAMYEFYKVSKLKNIKPMSIIAYIMLVVYYITGNNFTILSYIIIIGAFVLLMAPILNIKYNFIDVAITLLGFIYAGIFFSFITLINQKPGGEFLVWLPLIASWGCDILAYYSGKHLGKHKLCPRVSPKKTVEGSIGGILGSTIVCGIYGIIIYQFFPEFSMLNYFIIGALCGVFCQFGDLVASSVKRYVGVKDYSNLIPGHGGILDRFDSVLFASVVVFVYLTIATIIIHL